MLNWRLGELGAHQHIWVKGVLAVLVCFLLRPPLSGGLSRKQCKISGLGGLLGQDPSKPHAAMESPRVSVDKGPLNYRMPPGCRWIRTPEIPGKIGGKRMQAGLKIRRGG